MEGSGGSGGPAGASDVEIRDATADERAWADRVYASIDFATTAADDVQLVALRGAAIVGLGRLVDVGGGSGNGSGSGVGNGVGSGGGSGNASGSGVGNGN